MGRYSNVNARSLLTAVMNALNEISKYDLTDVSNTLNKEDVFSSPVKEKIIKSLNNINTSKALNGSVATLKDKLDKLKEAANLITNCQTLEKDITNLQARLRKPDGSINQAVQREINNKKNSLSNNETRVDKLLS